MIDALTNSGALPVLERLIQFTGRRHQLISHNVANLSTPGFRPSDVDVQAFQAQLAKAIDARRSTHGATRHDLNVQSSTQVRVEPTRLTLNPEPTGENLLFQDGNDRDVERIMQGLVENFMTFRAAAQLFKNRIESIQVAIRERM
jgi:flagellar basal-body rod protein FlgB